MTSHAPAEPEHRPSAASRAGRGSPAGADDPVGEVSPADESDPVGERQVPFFCPYCGEEELRPGGAKPGQWECRACSRGFQLRFAGVVS